LALHRPAASTRSTGVAPFLAIHQVVKRRSACTSELSFQLVQGYKVPETATAKAAEATKGAHSYSLSSWQRSGHQFSSHRGFSAPALGQLLDRLATFAGADRFDAANHAATFGAWEGRYAGAPVSPAFAFRELADDTILGHGARPLADSLASWLAGQMPHDQLMTSSTARGPDS
jgi:hypothetical protein